MGRETSEMKKIDAGQIRIERMKEEDIEEIMAIERASFPSPWMKNMFLQELRDRSLSHFLVAKLEGQVVGYGGFRKILDEAHIGNLAVHPHFRRRKIGEKLLTAMLTLAESRGIREAALEVRAGNLPARNLYGKFGFRIVDRQRGYYRDTREEALIMSLSL